MSFHWSNSPFMQSLNLHAIFSTLNVVQPGKPDSQLETTTPSVLLILIGRERPLQT
ncbi:hypothetical protein SNOG_13341 [Parastagonospora nodorum SN15]|uniref:Uncharacterized protein n=1 Tax=Phaeosphaeria nodorum (strain SN15 / ATCC MYA-4574 / FGSC 10173) TaxID=321614 RepID=Q0U4H3_PHANO|nr:hypothetical protein SNOG_13341 [Parastagonospora nodorum SN15]EAT79225.1 hypothetical protein SNOG_13341 [Parastagonospora nodorum SN15]